MHFGSFCRGFSACGCPHFFYFFRRFSVIFCVGDGVVPFLLVSHHGGNDFLRVEMFEVFVHPCCNRCEFGFGGDAWDAFDCICMRAFIEMDVLVPRMRVLSCEVCCIVGVGFLHWWCVVIEMYR